jgi:hypothetical protein
MQKHKQLSAVSVYTQDAQFTIQMQKLWKKITQIPNKNRVYDANQKQD